MDAAFKHIAVMPDEVMSFFKHAEGKTLVDATAGGGGHLLLLLQAVGEKGRVFAFDRDPRAHESDAAFGIAQKHPTTVTLFKETFSRIPEVLASVGVTNIDGLVCDLGVSSHQLDDQSRGFSFMAEGPIDMRMDRSTHPSAYEWLEQTREQAIADVLFHFGGERKSRAVARAIKNAWPIENNTKVLAQLVLSALRQRKWSKIHPATRTFQAIRMAVNRELEELEALLSHVPTLLAVGGVAVFLSFHSVEDRLIKNAFKELSSRSDSEQPSFKILTKKPLMASEQEIIKNRRARSAKLRAIMRMS